MSDITSQTLTSLVKNIKEKKLSSEEVTKAFVDRSEKSKELNAYITEDFSNAIDKAKKFDEKPNLDLKLPGIPMAVKDLFCTKDIRTTAGSKILENFVPTYESTVTENIWNEGGILLGKLNCDEFAMGSSNETSFYGNVQNPIDKGLVPGGSSGGSAAAVSGQLTPITIGTDTGGSIRQPASFTGTVGLKPTYGSCSRYGIVAFASSLDQAGPMTQNVKDCALLQEVISTYDNKDSTSIDFKRAQYSKDLTKDIKDYIIDSGWDSNKVSFIPNFVNSNKNTTLDLEFSKNKTLIAMGRFHENKGFDVLIKSLSFLPNYSLILVGQGSLKEFYEELIEKYNLKKRVKIFNWTDDISAFLNSASVLICPSRHEPFGNIIIDGWAHKIPVIAANVSGPGNLIKEKVNGLKFEKNDIFDLVKKIKEIQKNKKLKEKIIKNAFEEYNKKFKQELIVKKYISFFKKIIK